jgi:DNA invertase Pin-like site-specific DNA recombinase
MKVVFYGRYSDASQSEQSIEGLRKTCHDFAERNGYTIIGEYIDRAISGIGAENRPEFLRMIADSAKRQFQFVVVYQLDRFSRNRYDSATFKAKLKRMESKYYLPVKISLMMQVEFFLSLFLKEWLNIFQRNYLKK